MDPFDTTEGSWKREPVTRAEILKSLPQDLGECVRIWATLEWHAYFLMMYTAGLRPRDVSAFQLRDRILEGLRTVSKGMAVKAVAFSDRLEEVLQSLVLRGAPRSGVERGKRTQYGLRHTYYTELLKAIPERDVGQLAGHTTLRKEYDHRKGIDFLRSRAAIRAAVNRLTA